MKVQHVERFDIEFQAHYEGFARSVGIPEQGTTVEELIRALRKLPKKGFVQSHNTGRGLTVVHYRDDIDPECPYEQTLTAALNEMAQATYIPLQYISTDQFD
ncbi:hypothetical protein PBI_KEZIACHARLES14_45 [Mycobacterium phage Keziacharles14]|nr:hypothetical protein PBI_KEZIACHARLES14_45 [Mycobacterium phage Keziacharles14]